MIRLIRLVAPFWKRMALALAAGAATVFSGISLMATSAWLLSSAALHPSIAELGVAIVGVRFFGIARGVFRYLERYVSHSVTFRLLARLRVWFYEALEPLAPARLMAYRSGDILSRAIADIETLQDFYVRAIAPPMVAVLVILAMGLWFGWFSPSLAGVLILFLILTGVGVPALVRWLSRRPSQVAIAQRAELESLLVDSLQGMPDAIAFEYEQVMLDKVEVAGASLINAQQRLAHVNALQSGLSHWLMNTGMWGVLVIAMGFVNTGQLPGVMLATLVLGALAAFEAVLPLPLAAQAWESSRAAALHLFDLVDTPPVVDEPVSPSPLPLDFALEVSDLHFQYSPEDPPALDGVSFAAPPGKRIAIVGPSGAGKSTLVNLLLRFWEYEAGRITLGGIDLRTCSTDDVRRAIGVISQQTYLFNASIRANLLLARPDATQVEIVEATKRAHLHDFIESLPHGYDTWVGEHGLSLSGGERQRLAIARALLRETPILILDEPTANLDPRTESAVLQAIFEAMEGRTLILITHRLVGLEAMDEILVLDRGREVERGTQKQLLENKGLYHQLWTLSQSIVSDEWVHDNKNAP